MLVELGNRIVNTDHIVSAEPVEMRGGSGWRLTLTRGDAVTVQGGSPELDWLCGAIVPAPPGFVLVEAFLPGLVEGEEEIVYRESTILAFRIAPGPTPPTPITIEGEAVAHEDLLLAVVDPNGRCVGEATPYDSLAEFKSACERRVVKRREAARSAPLTPEVPGRHTVSFHPVEDEPATAPAEPHREPTTVEKLRATILAEPIAAPFADSPWRTGSDLAEVIDEVRRAHPDLHAAGVGYSPKWGWNWGPGDLERERAEMTAQGNIQAFEASLRFLSHAGRQFAQRRVNRARTSYSWKHAVERIMGGYVPNGMLIAAAYALGFTVEIGRESSSAWINLSEKAIALDPGKGMT